MHYITNGMVLPSTSGCESGDQVAEMSLNAYCAFRIGGLITQCSAFPTHILPPQFFAPIAISLVQIWFCLIRHTALRWMEMWFRTAIKWHRGHQRRAFQWITATLICIDHHNSYRAISQLCYREWAGIFFILPFRGSIPIEALSRTFRKYKSVTLGVFEIHIFFFFLRVLSFSSLIQNIRTVISVLSQIIIFHDAHVPGWSFLSEKRLSCLSSLFISTLSYYYSLDKMGNRPQVIPRIIKTIQLRFPCWSSVTFKKPSAVFSYYCTLCFNDNLYN